MGRIHKSKQSTSEGTDPGGCVDLVLFIGLGQLQRQPRCSLKPQPLADSASAQKYVAVVVKKKGERTSPEELC
jgi:hypothetical protein